MRVEYYYNTAQLNPTIILQANKEDNSTEFYFVSSEFHLQTFKNENDLGVWRILVNYS